MRKPEAGPQFRTCGTRYYSDRIRGCRSASRSVYKANWVRLERQLRYDHFPGIALYAVAILRLRRLAAPSHDGQNRGGPAPCSRQERHGVLLGAAANVDSPNGRGLIVREARKRGTTRSDLLLLAESIDDKLGESGIRVEDTPRKSPP